MAAPGKFFKLFFKNPENRLKIFKWYVHWKAIYGIGESEIGFLKQLTGFQSVAVYYLVAEQMAAKMGWHISINAIMILIPCWLLFKFCLYLTMGIFWDRNKYVQLTQEWHNKRNIMLQEIKDKVKQNAID
jgi:hypothetical protein